MLACEECGWKGEADEAGAKVSRFEDAVEGRRGSLRILVCPECDCPVGEGFASFIPEEETTEELPF